MESFIIKRAFWTSYYYYYQVLLYLYHKIT